MSPSSASPLSATPPVQLAPGKTRSTPKASTTLNLPTTWEELTMLLLCTSPTPATRCFPRSLIARLNHHLSKAFLWETMSSTMPLTGNLLLLTSLSRPKSNTLPPTKHLSKVNTCLEQLPWSEPKVDQFSTISVVFTRVEMDKT